MMIFIECETAGLHAYDPDMHHATYCSFIKKDNFADESIRAVDQPCATNEPSSKKRFRRITEEVRTNHSSFPLLFRPLKHVTAIWPFRATLRKNRIANSFNLQL